MVKRTLRPRRMSDLRGALAVEVLEARARGDRDLELIVELPGVSARAARAVGDFMKRVAPDVRFRLEAVEATAAKPSAPPRRGTADTFTDMNSWLLKYLLLAPGGADVRSLRELAEATETSLPTAQRFVDTFSDLGHVVRGANGFEVVRRASLMDLWLSSRALTRDTRISLRSLYGKKRLLSELATAMAAKKVSSALGGFAACEAQSLRIVVEGGPVEVHVDARGLERCLAGAEPVERRDADLLVVPSTAQAASVFRPLAWEKRRATNTLPPVDLVQAALDVWGLPAHGGREQARYIIDDVFGWTDG